MTKTQSTYTVTLLDGETVTFKSKLPLAWAVVVEDSQDHPWATSRHGVYFKSGSREAASKKAQEARGISGEYAFARVAIVPIATV